MRIRVRGGLDYRFNDQWSATLQARSGPHGSQQSPHITIHDFDGNGDGPYEFDFERWHLKFRRRGLEVWAGRNTLSFWNQDDLFVFDNVSYAGTGASYRHRAGAGQLSWHLNVVALPVGLREFSGTGVVGQVAYESGGTGAGFTIALAYFGTDSDAGDRDGQPLLTENNTRDYRSFNLQLQHRSLVFGRPLRAGLDYSHNAKRYDGEPADSFSRFHADDVDGFVAQLHWGSHANAGDWLFAYFFTYQEALATHSSYVQDDWVRWGSATQARATNLKGSEFRAIYTINPQMNVNARLFFVEAIDPLHAGDPSREDGNRLRIDWNLSF